MAGTLKQGAKAPTKAASIAASINAAPHDADFDDLFYEAAKEENNMLRDHFNEEQRKAKALKDTLKNAESEITFWKTKYDTDVGKNEKELEQYKKTLQRKVPRKISEVKEEMKGEVKQWKHKYESEKSQRESDQQKHKFLNKRYTKVKQEYAELQVVHKSQAVKLKDQFTMATQIILDKNLQKFQKQKDALLSKLTNSEKKTKYFFGQTFKLNRSREELEEENFDLKNKNSELEEQVLELKKKLEDLQCSTVVDSPIDKSMQESFTGASWLETASTPTYNL